MEQNDALRMVVAWCKSQYIEPGSDMSKALDVLAAPAPASPAALTVPEKITVSMAPTSEYAIGWNDCVDAILAALMEWRIKVAGPAGHERFETFKGETLDSACDAARGQGFYVVEDEDGRPVEEMNSWRK